MPTIDEYRSGKIFEFMKQIDLAVELLRIPLLKNIVRIKLTEKIEKYRDDFVPANQDELEDLINSASTVAVGPRICYHLYQKDLSHAIYMDELAKVLIHTGHAKEISKEEAIIVMIDGKKNGRSQLISKVSGRPLELCNQSPGTCSL